MANQKLKAKARRMNPLQVFAAKKKLKPFNRKSKRK